MIYKEKLFMFQKIKFTIMRHTAVVYVWFYKPYKRVRQDNKKERNERI